MLKKLTCASRYSESRHNSLFLDTPGEYEAQRAETQETLITSKASL